MGKPKFSLEKKSNGSSISLELSNLKKDYLELVDKYQKVLQDNESLNAIINTVVAHDSLMEDQLDDELQQVKYLANHDPLTNIYNRLSFNDFIQRQVDRNLTKGNRFSLIMFDVDHFKQINDVFGHSRGDEVLVAITQGIKRLLPDSCIFCRWGGEEFMILLPDFTGSQAYDLAQYLRISVEKITIPEGGRLSCSFGVTEYQSGEPTSVLYERVDRFVYEAKENGRNQVIGN